MAERVRTEVVDGVGLVTLCGAGPQNAMTDALWRDLTQAMVGLRDDSEVRAVVLTGGGHTAFATDPEQGDPEAARAAIASVADCPKPVVARIRGDCTGGGLALVMAADIRVAAADSAFSIGPARALALQAVRPVLRGAPAGARLVLLTGTRLEAAEALRLGLIDRLVADAELSDAVTDLLSEIVSTDPAVLAELKRAMADAAS